MVLRIYTCLRVYPVAHCRQGGRWESVSGAQRLEKRMVTEKGGHMVSRTVCRLLGWVSLCLVIGIAPATRAQAQSDNDLARQGAIALAAAHGEKPRYGGTFVSAGNEEILAYDMHQTSLGGIFAAVSPAYNCLVRTSP